MQTDKEITMEPTNSESAEFATDAYEAGVVGYQNVGNIQIKDEHLTKKKLNSPSVTELAAEGVYFANEGNEKSYESSQRGSKMDRQLASSKLLLPLSVS